MTVQEILLAIRKRRPMSRPNLYATYLRPMGIKAVGKGIPRQYPPDTINRVFGAMGILDDEPKHGQPAKARRRHLRSRRAV